jgi:hypothetical protein
MITDSRSPSYTLPSFFETHYASPFDTVIFALYAYRLHG